MSGNIKLNYLIPSVFIVITIVFLIEGFNILDVIMIVSSLAILVYYIMAHIKGKNALKIEDDRLFVTTPIKHKEYDIKLITELQSNNHIELKGIYEDHEVVFCSNIYDLSIEEIRNYLLSHYPHIKRQSESSK